MIIVLRQGASDADIDGVTDEVRQMGYDPHLSKGVERTVIGAIGDERGKERLQSLEGLDCVEQVIPILKPYKLAGWELHTEKSQISVGGCVPVGGETIQVAGGPCCVESHEQVTGAAVAVKEAGGSMLRGGAYKPRTSPYSFQGLEEEGLKILAAAREKTGLPVVTEVMQESAVGIVADYADMLQVGTRNMQNFNLLKALGRIEKPILLKRGMSATIKEWLMSAEYIMSQGNHNVILCERGIRTFETATRNTLDLSSIPVLRQETHLPVIVDPSHAAGHHQYVIPLALAAIAAGADGLMVEVHPKPSAAWSDGAQSLQLDAFGDLMKQLKKVVLAVDRKL